MTGAIGTGTRVTSTRTIRRPAGGLRLVGAAVTSGVILTSVASCASEQAVPTSTEPAPVETTVARERVIHEFVIPDGTAARLAAGEEVEVIPPSIEVRVGDKIRVRNDDSEFARLGIFDVRAGETVTMTFNTPGKMEGIIFSDESSGCGVPRRT
ncbi:MAG: hypothetical protein M5U19_17320 [Microthrixaceae bacterium]|nr:hypothetical protein [Microthrixaceae bacterium]